LNRHAALVAAGHFCYLAPAMTEDSSLPFVIRFESVSLADAGRHAAALREVMLDMSSQVQAQLERVAGDTMDMGSSLRASVPAPAVMPVSRGIADYLARERPGMVVIEHQGRVVYRGDGADPGPIARALAGRDGRGW
jgi:hypothetical protein